MIVPILHVGQILQVELHPLVFSCIIAMLRRRDTSTSNPTDGRSTSIVRRPEPFPKPLEFLLPPQEHDPAREAFVRCFLAEHGRRLQRLASVANENAPPVQPDEEWLDDGPQFCRRTGMSERQLQALDRTMWVIDLAWDREKVWLLAGFGLLHWEWPSDHEDMWDVHTPTLRDVLGSHLLKAFARLRRHERDRAESLVRETLDRMQEQGIAKTAAGILAAMLASLVKLADPDRKDFDRVLDLPLPRVLTPGGQTAAYVPLA